jgi:hypothetical protein
MIGGKGLSTAGERKTLLIGDGTICHRRTLTDSTAMWHFDWPA